MCSAIWFTIRSHSKLAMLLALFPIRPHGYGGPAFRNHHVRLERVRREIAGEMVDVHDRPRERIRTIDACAANLVLTARRRRVSDHAVHRSVVSASPETALRPVRPSNVPMPA
jgi:hypothetical protein